ncbi:MAG: hypothetical protein MAG715_00463 [Methanonatronarchaeales archaeon]|nr:hypothetical protein [Methanonatronarchaeales archaeon]
MKTAAKQVQGRLASEGPLVYTEICPDGEEAEVMDFRFVSRA